MAQRMDTKEIVKQAYQLALKNHASNPIAFEFVKIYPGSEVAAVFGLSQESFIAHQWYACEAWNCPDCGRKTAYITPVPHGINLNDPAHEQELLAVTGRAMIVPYHCSACDTKWTSLVHWWLSKWGEDEGIAFPL